MVTQKREVGMSITEVAIRVGVTAKTLVRWEKSKRIPKPKRDFKGWRWYTKADFKKIKRVKEKVTV